MRTVIVNLESNSPYSQGKHVSLLEHPYIGGNENKAVYEKRTWMHKMHVDDKGYVFIPPMAFKLSLCEAAQYMSIKIPGKGNSTYTKNFVSGVQVIQPATLPIKAEDVPCYSVFVPSDGGNKGGGSRVEKFFPIIYNWKATVEYLIFDSSIPKDVFIKHLATAGTLIGIGVFRPRNAGYYGRYSMTDIEWGEFIDT